MFPADLAGYLSAMTTAKMPSVAPGLLLGLGLGGFIDGIVLHEILQWHHMVSHVDDYPTDTVAGLEVNVLADGFFHVATWLLVWAGTIATLVSFIQVVAVYALYLFIKWLGKRRGSGDNLTTLVGGVR